MVIKAPLVKKLFKNPVKTAEIADLEYADDSQLTIQRHRHGRGFYYTRRGKRISSKRTLNRIKSLVIPPAWKNVRISHLKNSHIQVKGTDDQSRLQYIYHPLWSKLRNQTKFAKMTAFGKVLPEIRKQVDLDLKLPTMCKRKCLALVLRLMEETHIRIGSDYYAKKNKSYGLTTLRSKHLDIYKDNIKFTFTGKRGIEHTKTIRDKKLLKLVQQCEEIPGWQLFKYYDENGAHHTIDSGMVNEYIRELSGELFSAKDFRTWAGSKIFFENLYKIGPEDDQKQAEKNTLTAYDTVAEALGNTRSVCRQYYVHPFINNSYLDKRITRYFKKLTDNEYPDNGLVSTERAMLDLIEKYRIEL